MSKKNLSGGLAAALLLVGSFAAAGSSADPGAEAAASLTPCNISGKEKSLGASYVTSLKVDGVSCAKGESVVKSYHECRKDKGGGVCGNPGGGYSCREGKRVGVPDVQYNATVKCRKGDSKLVKSSYTENV